MHFIHREAGYAFVNKIRDRDTKLSFLNGDERTLNEAVSQALRLEAVKPAARLLSACMW
jgi:hypothetical protein